MKAFPPATLVTAALAAAVAPFHFAAAFTLLVTAGLGCIIHADFNLRYRCRPLPKLQPKRRAPRLNKQFARHRHPLAA